ncbi:MAG: hypothetical protein P8Y60_14025 [Calditrichota bacterium]
MTFKWLDRGRQLLQISDGSVTQLSDVGLPWSLSGVWLNSFNAIAVGDGIFSKTIPEIIRATPWQAHHQGLTPFYSHAVRGNAVNNIFIAGAYGEILHYNGLRWKSLRSETIWTGGSYLRVDVKNNVGCAVGFKSGNGLILLGRQ